ncbi:hypothetical protein [Nocardia arthritidis]|uniref:Uncharacterized protein n=1 Tax=Nocardia arthritidis TaxID=228602 RepID=A0A6G9YUI3_9NOCA|nr:hypothetical protein [Nocardia arthritidis]QIS16787.1 hypothetical protein F5544_44920 [Nocardia arthritidis]
MASANIPVKWKDEPEEHDYPAAADYLELLADPDTVAEVIEDLRKAPIVHKKAKDILRAANLELLSPENPYVRNDLIKINAGKSLSPILLVRGDFRKGAPMVIADGYHRVCAIHWADENIAIPAKIAARP